MIEEMNVVLPGFCGMGLHWKLDGFRLVYVLIAVLMWGVSGAFPRNTWLITEEVPILPVLLGYFCRHSGSLLVGGSVHHFYLF